MIPPTGKRGNYGLGAWGLGELPQGLGWVMVWGPLIFPFDAYSLFP